MISQPRSDVDLLSRGIDETRSKLLDEFQDRVQRDVIDRTVDETFDSLKNAAVVEYVPLFVYRSAREQLFSLTRNGD